MLVGIWNTIFGFIAFCILDTLFARLFKIRYFAYTSAQIISIVLSVINAYIFHKYITFKSTVKGRKMIAEFFRFSMTYGVTFSLSLILLPLFVEVIHIGPKLAMAIILFICAGISYLGHSRFSFNLTANKIQKI